MLYLKIDHLRNVRLFYRIEDTLRGFSEAIRIGRFAFLSPLQSAEGVYSSKLIRISLGDTDIGKFHIICAWLFCKNKVAYIFAVPFPNTFLFSLSQARHSPHWQPPAPTYVPSWTSWTCLRKARLSRAFRGCLRRGSFCFSCRSEILTSRATASAVMAPLSGKHHIYILLFIWVYIFSNTDPTWSSAFSPSPPAFYIFVPSFFFFFLF